MILANFPVVSQLTKTTPDGKAPTNAQFDCVGASIDAVCRWLLNKPENSVFNPEDFKDEAYGAAYTGGTSAEQYVAFCKTLGIDLYPIYCASASATIAMAHQFLDQNKAVIFTEIDPYVDTALPQYAGWTHVCVFNQSDSAGLTAMDPYVAKQLYKSDATWASVLAGTQLWTADLIGDQIVPITFATPGVSSFYKQIDATHWQVIAPGASHGLIVQDGILSLYCRIGTPASGDLCGLEWLGLPVSNEIPLDAYGNTKQYFERGCLVYNPKGGKVRYDNPPGSGAVYTPHVYGAGALGQDPGVEQIVALNTSLTQQVAALTAQLAGGSSKQLADLQSVKAIVAPY